MSTLPQVPYPTSKNNYRNRRARGQCALCTRQSTKTRCEECRKKYNAAMREFRFHQSLAREARLEEIERQLAAEVAELDRIIAARRNGVAR
jgi:t-SNARE complex subunit (syntaxin)